MRIYVGNLPFTITEEELVEMFGEYGEVTSTAIIKDKFSGASRGFGFVEMADSGSGLNAINALNGKDMGGRPLTVNEARPREDNDRGGGGGGGRRRN
jgi:RNA recognition motif-containing protein